MLRTKLHRPAVTKEHVFRTSLIERLENNRSKPITLVSAGAGYGKTMLISSWLEQTKEASGWISLDSGDNNVRSFVEYIIVAIQQKFANTLIKSEALINSPELPPDHLIWEELINELDEILDESFVLVLDDYHLINDQRIHEFLRLYLKFPPQNMHIVVLTRYDPPIDLTSLRAHSRIHEIRMNELALQPIEIVSLFKNQNNIELSEQLVSILVRTTEGWVAGLRITSMAISSYEDAESVIRSLDSGLFNVSEFLEQQVLLKQPAEYQQLLVISSIFERFNADLINHVCLGNPSQSGLSGAEFIDWLVSSNMFIIELDVEKNWFRFHHVFKDLLSEQFEKIVSKSETIAYHKKASQWFETATLYEDSFSHLKMISDYEAMASFVELRKSNELEADRWYNLEYWLRDIPEEVVNKRPALLLTIAWIRYQQARIEDLITVIESLKKNQSELNDSTELAGELDFFNGTVSYFLKDGPASCKYLELAIKKLGTHKCIILGEAQFMYGLALLMTNRKESAVAMLNENLASEGVEHKMYQTRIIIGLMFIEVISADLVNAKKASLLMNKMNTVSKSQYAIGWGDYLSGWVAFNRFDLDEAIEYFNLAIGKRFVSDTSVTINAFVGLILCYGFSHRITEANNFMSEFRKYLSQIDLPEFYRIADTCQIRLDSIGNKSSNFLDLADKEPMAYDPIDNLIWLDLSAIFYSRVAIEFGSEAQIRIAFERLLTIRSSIKVVNFTCQEVDVILLLAVASFKLNNIEKAMGFLSEALSLSATQRWIRPFIEIKSMIPPILDYYLVNEKKDNAGFLNEIGQIIRDDSVTSLTDDQDSHSANRANKPVDNNNSLTIREREILQLVAEGYRNKEIADKLFISLDGVKKHLYRTFIKLDVKSRIELVNKAVELKLLIN